MIKENRYLVFKYTDINKYLNETQMRVLLDITNTINMHRKMDLKEPVTCVVVEHDWPEYHEVWGMLEARVDGPQKNYVVTCADPDDPAEISDWCTEHCKSYLGMEIQDVSDVSYLHDLLVTYAFSKEVDAINMRDEWNAGLVKCLISRREPTHA